MGFLDNSGDIILDAVLTDTGRFRLAKGDGSFKITKFALGDEEIDYSKYNKNDASGSAYYDLEIMQTPVLEAFTNNASSMSSMLMSMTRNNLLYLPILKLNEVSQQNTRYSTGEVFVVAVDQATETQIQTDASPNNWTQGVIAGQTGGTFSTKVLVEQGLDTTEISDSIALDPDLVETQYIVEMDNRFGKIRSVTNGGGGSIASPSYIDDDNVASYYFSSTRNGDLVLTNWRDKINPNVATVDPNLKAIRGPKGTRLKFMIASTLDLSTSSYLFSTLGGTGFTIGSTSYNFIDSIIRVVGGTTGYTLDIPVRYIKKP
jgi:hypothetical protein